MSPKKTNQKVFSFYFSKMWLKTLKIGWKDWKEVDNTENQQLTRKFFSKEKTIVQTKTLPEKMSRNL